MSASQQKAIPAGKLVETTNALSKLEFAREYCNSETLHESAREIEELTGRDVNIVLLSAKDLKSTHKDVLDACVDFVEASSADDYKKSEMRWSLTSKRKEMLLPDMKYLVMQERSSSSDNRDDGLQPVCGFTSFMITYEDGHEVVYIYEIHLQPAFCGLGIGKILLGLVEYVGRRIKVEKAMLTVFKSNKRAVKWYDRMRYTTDEFSPDPRVLRNGTVKEPSYVILSKML